MVLKLAANLNFLFAELPSMASRIQTASQRGFKSIEIPFVEQGLQDEVLQAKKQTGINVSLINIKTCTSDHQLKFGSASVPGAEDTFATQLEDTINFAKAMGCRKIHLMAGTMSDGSYVDHWNTYQRNLSHAASRLKSENLIGVIEPINPYALPNYFMNSFERAAALLRELKSDHLKLMVDIFHLQHLRGNIANTLKELADIIGHIQIAQAPHRHEPDVPGELDFQYVFQLIEESNYQDYIGCEYKPKTTTAEGLKWVEKFNLKL